MRVPPCGKGGWRKLQAYLAENPHLEFLPRGPVEEILSKGEAEAKQKQKQYAASWYRLAPQGFLRNPQAIV